MRGGVRRRRIDPALEPPGGLRGQLVPARGPGDGHGVPVRRLDHHRRRGRRQFRRRAAHDTGQADRPRIIGDQEITRLHRTHDIVQRCHQLVDLGVPDDDRPGEPVAIEAMDGLTGLQHHVVGDVDGQRDRPHSGQLNPPRHPPRAGSVGLDAGHGQGHEDRAGRSLQADRISGLDRLGHGAGHRVGEAHVNGLGRLPGQPTDGQAVSAIRGHRDVQHVVPEMQHGSGVLPGLEIGLAQHDDPGVVLAEPEFFGRTDHAVRHVPVRPAGRDGGPSGKHRTRQRHHDDVAVLEVVRAADDSARFGLPDVHGTPADLLAVRVLFHLVRQHGPDHHRAGDVGAGRFDRLHLQPGSNQAIGQLPAGQLLRQGGVLAQPGQRRPHRAPPRSERLKRTSPSTMSRRSSALLRNIMVRSTPMPKAKPV